MSEGRRPHILVGNLIALNRGDAAILAGLVRGLRRRLGTDLRVTVLATQPDAAARYHPELDVDFRESLGRVVFRAGRSHRTRIGRSLEREVMRRLSPLRFRAAMFGKDRRVPLGDRLLTPMERELVALFDDADFFIAPGGTNLVENYSLDSRLLEFRLAMSRGMPLALFTQSLGRYGPRNAERLRPVFSYSSLNLLRDDASLEHLRATGATTSRSHVVADAAFTLGDASVVREARTRALSPADGLRVGISVRSWPFFKTKSNAQGMRDVLSAFADLSEHLTRTHGASVTFVSTCQGVPEYWKDDSLPAKEIVDLVSGRGSDTGSIRVDADFRSPDDLLQHYRSYDVVVGMRMHAAILALAGGVPVLPVAYEPKTRSLFEKLGFGDWVLDVETLNGPELCATFDRLLAELPARRAALFDAVIGEMESAEAGLDLLAQTIEDRHLFFAAPRAEFDDTDRGTPARTGVTGRSRNP